MGDTPPAVQTAEPPREAAKRHLRGVQHAALDALEQLQALPDGELGPVLASVGDVHLHAAAAETALTGRPPGRLDWVVPGPARTPWTEGPR